MPKIETLDALGDAITTILTTIKICLGFDMLKICPKYSLDMPKGPRNAQDLPIFGTHMEI